MLVLTYEFFALFSAQDPREIKGAASFTLDVVAWTEKSDRGIDSYSDINSADRIVSKDLTHFVCPRVTLGMTHKFPNLRHCVFLRPVKIVLDQIHGFSPRICLPSLTLVSSAGFKSPSGLTLRHLCVLGEVLVPDHRPGMDMTASHKVIITMLRILHRFHHLLAEHGLSISSHLPFSVGTSPLRTYEVRQEINHLLTRAARMHSRGVKVGTSPTCTFTNIIGRTLETPLAHTLPVRQRHSSFITVGYSYWSLQIILLYCNVRSRDHLTMINDHQGGSSSSIVTSVHRALGWYQ
ncbi:hypothetical protein BV22DRAFT_504345 [Leucogyrophana mollusca]|uniref:Uncharacterized protein n=1 Tax=Leucogyrophana mollusca TaxID=85980 RepID=A0ACB8BH50_9AGAM|nr:hypothetical protein BV22DRAFT_504345 [Leucogyrophana mollusca]